MTIPNDEHFAPAQPARTGLLDKLVTVVLVIGIVVLGVLLMRVARQANGLKRELTKLRAEAGRGTKAPELARRATRERLLGRRRARGPFPRAARVSGFHRATIA